MVTVNRPPESEHPLLLHYNVILLLQQSQCHFLPPTSLHSPVCVHGSTRASWLQMSTSPTFVMAKFSMAALMCHTKVFTLMPSQYQVITVQYAHLNYNLYRSESVKTKWNKCNEPGSSTLLNTLNVMNQQLNLLR